MADSNETKTTQSRPQPPSRIDAARNVAARAAGTAIDVPIGIASAAVEQAGDLVGSGRSAARTELNQLSHELRNELDEAERRGGVLRRELVGRAREAGGHLERNLSDARGAIAQRIRDDRIQATRRVRDAGARLQRSRGGAERQARGAVARVNALA